MSERHPVETLWREIGLPEYFLGNGGTNRKLYALYDAIRASTPDECILLNQVEIMGALTLLLRYVKPDLVGKAGELDRQRDDLYQRHKATQLALAVTRPDSVPANVADAAIDEIERLRDEIELLRQKLEFAEFEWNRATLSWQDAERRAALSSTECGDA